MYLNSSTRQFLSILSQIFGWTYIICWGISFYPQPILNWQRKSVVGSSVDFPFFNVIGFTCYTLNAGFFLFSPYIRSQYAIRHPASPEPTTQLNDFVFGAHAVVLVIIAYSQYFKGVWGFTIPQGQRVSRPIIGISVACGIFVVIVVIIMLAKNGLTNQDAKTWAWIDVIYALGIVKLVSTVTKYIPQVLLNYQRKSTVGWAISTVLLDLVGSVLSFAQLIVDASLQNDWSGIAGNPVKLGLSNISLIFDLIFVVQHYILYRHNRKQEEDKKEGERAPLIDS